MCKLITIEEINSFKGQLIHQLTGGDIELPSLWFTVFKRLSCVNMRDNSYEVWEQNLQLIDMALIHIDWLLISEENIEKLYASHQDELINLKVDQLHFKTLYNNISEKSAKILSSINFKSLYMNSLNEASLKNIENTFLLFLLIKSKIIIKSRY